MKIIVIGCGSAKARTHHPIPARQLYTGCLFKARRRYAEEQTTIGYHWYIASALHGLVAPDELLLPYNFTIAELNPDERLSWGAAVLARLERDIATARPLGHQLPVIELHVGRAYAEPIKQARHWFNLLTESPTAGMTQGSLLRYYKRQRAQP